jgi:hypothetical protein
MCGAISPFPQYVFMEWCPVKTQGQLYFLQCTALNEGIFMNTELVSTRKEVFVDF